MKFLDNVGTAIKVAAKKGGLKVKAKSPEILMVVGAVTFVGTVVVACKQTLKAEEILDEHERRLKDIEDVKELAKETPESVSYPESEERKDRAIAVLHTGCSFAKLYAPAILLGAVSITCFGASYGIMKKRNVALSVAYTTLSEAFTEYRKRVKDDLGEEADEQFRYGCKRVKKASVVGKDEAGNDIVTEKEDVDTVPWDEGDGMLDNAVFLFAPETSKYYQPSEVLNDTAISIARNNLQIDFDINGHLFLNDALKALGLREVSYGQLVGWIKGIGDPYIDFRTKKVYRPVKDRPGYFECVYEFDFNTCGTMWDKI